MKLTKLILLVMAVELFLGSTHQVFAQNGRMDQELLELYAGTNVNPFDAAASNNLALKLFRQGHYERALKLLQRAQRLAPERLHIQQNTEYLQLLMSQVRNLDVETSRSLSRTFEKEEIPFVPDPWGQWGSRLGNGAGPRPADASASTGANSNPFDVDSLVAIADLKIKRGDMRGALTDLKRAERISPWISGLRDRIAQLEELVPAGVTSVTTGFDSPGTASDADDVPPPAAWSREDLVPRYQE